MSLETHQQRIAIVTACTDASGTPDFAFTEVDVTQEQIDTGIHYYLVEADLLVAGYEDPFLHFDQNEAPYFLHPAVRRYLGIPPAAEVVPFATTEKS